MRIENRRARARYTIEDTVEAGIALTGPEVKAVRLGHADLSDAYAVIRKGEMLLLNMRISPYKFARHEDHKPTRTRKLLLHRSEIVSLQTKIENTNLTLVPLCLYTKGSFVKVNLAVARGKKTYSRREELKKRAIQRDIESEIKERSR